MRFFVVEQDGRFRPVSPRPRGAVATIAGPRTTVGQVIPLALATLVVLAGFLFGQ